MCGVRRFMGGVACTASCVTIMRGVACMIRASCVSTPSRATERHPPCVSYHALRGVCITSALSCVILGQDLPGSVPTGYVPWRRSSVTYQASYPIIRDLPVPCVTFHDDCVTRTPVRGRARARGGGCARVPAGAYLPSPRRSPDPASDACCRCDVDLQTVRLLP